MSGEWRWNQKTILLAVQFDWEDEPTSRPVRLTGLSPIAGEPVRISMGGAEVEGMIVKSEVGVVHVRLAKPKMQKAEARTPTRRKKASR
jgi:hypothetical protein